jgi:hypothetical protein
MSDREKERCLKREINIHCGLHYANAGKAPGDNSEGSRNDLARNGRDTADKNTNP